MRKVYNSQGNSLSLGSTLGKGGEGEVLEVGEFSNFVAKIYHPNKAPDAQKSAKLAAMVSLRTERLLKLAAFPVDLLHDRPGGPPVGFLMPRVSGFKEIHTLYGPKARLANFPEATWPFLIHVAANLARAVRAIHEHGLVIGDINQANIVVSQQGLTMLIDCDSFQVTAQGQSFLCEVGVPTYTPPELQGRSFHGVVRTPNHDAFGLATAIFHLLFMGRHPFSGRYLGVGEMPIEKAIQEFRFAYGPQAGSRQMQPPPGTLALEAASQTITALFERAFAPGGIQNDSRPKPQEWVDALTMLSKQLKRCGRHTGHFFMSGQAACPWCAIEVQTGILLFHIPIAAGSMGTFHVDITLLWSQIQAVPSPGVAPLLPDKALLGVTPSPRAISLSALRRNWLAALWNGAELRKGRQQAQAALQTAQQNAQTITRRWFSECSDEPFKLKFRELQEKRGQYEQLPDLRQQKLNRLHAERQTKQLERFLDQFQLDTATINGIGPGRKATLQSYGIETAADVVQYRILSIPGFGPAFTSKLLAWRHSLERQFRFNPSLGVEPTDVANVEREITAQRVKLENELQQGLAQLRQISQQILAKRHAMKPYVEQALRTVAQAEADVQILN